MRKRLLIIINLLLLSTFNLLANKDSGISVLENKAYTALVNNQPDIARTYYLQLVQENPDSAELRAMCYNNLGAIDIREGFKVRGLDFLQKAIETYESAGKDTLLAKTLYNTGRSYKLLGQYEKATELLLRALNVFEEYEMKVDLAETYNVLGNLNGDLGNLETALRYHELACKIAIEGKDSIRLAMYLNNKGSTYFEMEFYKEAITDFQNSLTIKNNLLEKSYLNPEKKKIVKRSIPYTYYNLGETELQRGNIDRAIKNFKVAIDLHSQFNNERGVAYCDNFLGRAYFLKTQWDTAITYFNKALESAKNLEINDLLLNNYLFQYELYDSIGNKTKALEYYKLYSKKHQQILNLDKQKAINEFQIKYEVEKKEQENKLLFQKAEIDQLKIKQQEASIQFWQFFTVIIIILILFALFLVYKYYRLFGKEKKLAEKEKQLNREQHHRIKNHLQTLAGLLSFQQRKIEDNVAKEVIQESSNRVEVIKMLHLHFYQSGDYNSHTIQLHSYLQEIIENLVVLFDKTAIQVKKNIEAVLLSPEKALPLGLICNEIISNALKYGLNQDAKSELSISLKKEGEKITLIIKDNGNGNIVHENNSSIGLDLINQLAKQIDAKIDRDFTEGVKYTLIFSTKQ